MKEKLTHIVSAILLVFAGFFIYSCKTNEIANAIPRDLLRTAKKWHAHSDSVKNVLSPTWKRAVLNQLKNGHTQIIVPTKELPTSTESTIGIVRKLVFDQENGKITGGRIIEIYSDKVYVGDHKKDLVERSENGDLNDFTGSVMVYDVNYRNVGSLTYKNGTLIPAMNRIVQVKLSSPIGNPQGMLEIPLGLSVVRVLKMNDTGKEIITNHLVVNSFSIQKLQKLSPDESRKRFGVKEKTMVWIITPRPSAMIVNLSEFYERKNLRSKFKHLPLAIDGKFVADTTNVFIDMNAVETFKAKSDSIRIISSAYATQLRIKRVN